MLHRTGLVMKVLHENPFHAMRHALVFISFGEPQTSTTAAEGKGTQSQQDQEQPQEQKQQQSQQGGVAV